MHPPASSPDNHTKILDYWSRRKGLSVDEWQDFYRITAPILMKTQLPPEFADRKKREALIHTFFTDKIFTNAGTSKAGALKNVYALHTFLKRFALDIQRKTSHFASMEDFPEVLQPEVEEENSYSVPAIPFTQLLAEAGVDVNKAADSAGNFVRKLDRGESAYLRLHSCVEHEEREPISRIAKRLELGTAFHFKAKSLGITRDKGATYKGYEKTKIGRWLLSVGAKLSPEWQEELAVLLTLLCLKVHEHAEETA